MSSIVISGDTSGSVTLQAPAIAGSTVVTLPTTSMNIGTGGGSVASNTAFGSGALAANTTGGGNSAFGLNALAANTTANQNSAFGTSALAATTTGLQNAGFGRSTLLANTTGSANTAIGTDALIANTTASSNTAVGYQAGYTNVTGTRNTFLGEQTGLVSTGNNNTFVGTRAGYASTGVNNVFIGAYNDSIGGSGYVMTTGSKNTIIGGYTGNQGGLDIRTASNHVVLSDGDGNVRAYFDSTGICRMEPSAGGTGVLRAANMSNLSGDSGLLSSLGSNCSNTSSYFLIGTIRGVADRIYIYGNGNIQNTNGSYGAFSDVKLKENIVDATPKLADLMQVRVRNYNLKSDPTLKQIGVVAQELETIFPALVDESPDRDEEGNTLETTTKSVKYSVFVPMLIKAIQEQQALITTLTTRITALEAKVGA